jgi:hypothetical protein
MPGHQKLLGIGGNISWSTFAPYIDSRTRQATTWRQGGKLAIISG